MRVKISESLIDTELKDLLDELKNNLNSKVVNDNEDEPDYTIFIKGKVINETLFIYLIHKYNYGDSWNDTFTIHKDDEDRFILDSSDKFSPYNSRFHNPFNSLEDIVNYIIEKEL